MRRLNVVNRKQALKVVKEFDAFPKVPDSYKEQTVSGAGFSFVVFVFIAILVISELKYYSDTEMKYSYETDKDPNSKLPINIDITVAMKCNSVGADILDLTGQNAEAFGRLEEEDVVFDLTDDQRAYLKMISQINDYIKNEYHAIHDFLWRSGHTGLQTAMPPRKEDPTKTKDGCRFHGTLTVNKVAGNFHITAGKGFNLRGYHVHNAGAVDDKDYNFSHRIDHFSFGKPTPGVVNPMDGDYRITSDTHHMFQYFVQIVPTVVNTRQASVETCQYAVTDKNRTINHHKGSHGVPGIFVKYDLAPLMVTVKEEHKPYWQFLVRLSGIIGGVFATSGLLNALVAYVVDVLCCRFKLGIYKAAPKDNTANIPSYPNPLTDSPVHEPYNNSEPSTPLDTSPGISLLAAAENTQSWQQPLLTENNSHQ